MKKTATLLLLALLNITAAAQEQNGHKKQNPEDRPVDLNSPTFVPMVKVGKALENGDSIQYMELNKVYVYPQKTFANKRERRKYDRAVYNVKKVLPIAKEVNMIIIETYEYLQTLPNDKARQEHLKYVEQSIKKEYTPRMKKLTFAQGKLLIKLVYRECNSSAYGLIKAFLGPVRAGVWQAFAWIYGASLTKTYDPEGLDKETEKIVLQVEAGQL